MEPLSFCPVMSVTLVYCDQTVGQIKMQLGVQVGIGSGHIVLDGQPGPTPKKGKAPIFGPYLLWPNGSMDQDATWLDGMPQPKRHCVRCGPSSNHPEAQLPPPKFRPMSVMAKQLDESRCHLVRR